MHLRHVKSLVLSDETAKPLPTPLIVRRSWRPFWHFIENQVMRSAQRPSPCLLLEEWLTLLQANVPSNLEEAAAAGNIPLMQHSLINQSPQTFAHSHSWVLTFEIWNTLFKVMIKSQKSQEQSEIPNLRKGWAIPPKLVLNLFKKNKIYVRIWIAVLPLQMYSQKAHSFYLII